MDLPTMVQMLTPFSILHLEPTDACQASCPQCARETDVNFDKKDLHHLTVNQITNSLDDNLLTKLDKMFMCGDYGDPAAGRHTLDIYRFFRSVNSTITLGMNTNGGLRDQEWWRELAGILKNQRDYVVFSIDGLEDTNHIYRIGVNWDKVMENAKAYIDAGGSAHWDMLVFEHNEHQVDECERLAKTLGFTWFRAKVTKRHQTHPINFLNPPKGWKDPIVEHGIISCHALKEKSVYMSAQGLIYPCCYLGTTDQTIDQFESIKKSWATSSPVKMCHETCIENNGETSFSNQWQREVELR